MNKSEICRHIRPVCVFRNKLCHDCSLIAEYETGYEKHRKEDILIEFKNMNNKEVYNEVFV